MQLSFVIFYGIEKSINEKRKTATPIYQTHNVLEYETGLTERTIIKCIEELEELKLLHVVKHTERNKTKYKIDYDNLAELQKIIKHCTDKTASKTLANRNQFKRVVQNMYYIYLRK